MAGENVAAESAPVPSAKLKIAKIVEGDIMCLRLIGTIDEDFQSQELADSVKGTLIVDLGEVRRISSFGIRNWVDFVKASEQKCHAIYYIECAPKIIDQFNMVANFGGMGKVLSFYAPYRCDYCDDDRRRLVQVDESHELIQNLNLPDVPCDSCGNPEYFDEDPDSFFTYLAGQVKVEPDPAVANFLADKLEYRVSDAARRLRVDKVVDEATFVKLAGDVDANFPREKLAEGLEGDVIIDLSAVGRVDDEGALEWTAFVQMVAHQTNHLYLRDCQPGFVEKLFSPEAFAGKAEVVSFFMPFKCPSCQTSAAQRVDTAEHFDVLKFATSPEFECPECQTRAPSIASEDFLARLGDLIKPSPSKELLEFADEAHERLLKPADGGAAAAALPVVEVPAAGRTVGLSVIVAVLVSLLVVGGGVFLVFRQLQKEKKILYDEGGRVVEQSHKKPPKWLKGWKTHQVEKVGNKYYFIGYSYAVKDRDRGSPRALDDALERLAHQIALSVRGGVWKDAVLKVYRGQRDKAILALQKAMSAKDGPATRKARKRLWNRRLAVAKALQRSADVPKKGEEFWQRLQTNDGKRWRFWVRISVDQAKVDAYVDQFTKTVKTQGVSVANYFPGLAWTYPEQSSGAIVLGVEKDSKWLLHGLAVGNLVTSCAKRNLKSAKEFKEVVEDLAETFKLKGGRLECMTRSRGVTRPVGYAIAKVEKPKPMVIYRGSGMRGSTGASDVSTWDDPTQ